LLLKKPVNNRQYYQIGEGNTGKKDVGNTQWATSHFLTSFTVFYVV